MTAYYNEIDPYAAQWLRNLIAANLIAPGDVDERSIEDVRPDDLAGYTQCHFFAGIAGWSLALRMAGWDDSRPVWTGSCPCQPFSNAGKREGFADKRHLWPFLHRLIEQRQPDIVFGEQVASKDGLAWFDLVQADLEGTGYASGAIDISAAGIGAPEVRQRLYWFGERLADTDDEGLEGRPIPAERPIELPAGQRGLACRLVYSDSSRTGTQPRDHRQAGEEKARGARPDDGAAVRDGTSATRWLANADLGAGEQGRALIPRGDHRGHAVEGTGPCGDGGFGRPGPTNGRWRDADWLHCRDGKWRPVEPGTFPLAHGVSSRVGRLRAYGNAIIPQVAAEFIAAYLDVRAAA